MTGKYDGRLEGIPDPSPIGGGYLPGAWDEVRRLRREGHLSEEAWVILHGAIFGKAVSNVRPIRPLPPHDGTRLGKDLAQLELEDPAVAKSAASLRAIGEDAYYDRRFGLTVRPENLRVTCTAHLMHGNNADEDCLFGPEHDGLPGEAGLHSFERKCAHNPDRTCGSVMRDGSGHCCRDYT